MMKRIKIYFGNKLYNGCWHIKRWIITMYYNLRNRLRLNSTGVIYEKDIITTGKLIISNMGSIEIGKGVVINSGCYPNPVGTTCSRIYTERNNSSIKIGDGTGMSNVLIFCSESVYIGNEVMIGAETKIIDTDFHSVDWIKNSSGESIRGIVKSAPIIIEDQAFIGMNSIILKGVHIGKCSVIGAGSVVTKDIPAGEIWAGNPAHFVRKANIFPNE